MTVASAIAASMVDIVGPNAVRTWAEVGDERSRYSAAFVPDCEPACIVYPKSGEQLGEVVACARRDLLPVLFCGNGSKLSWGGLAAGIRVIVSTARLNRIIEHAAGDLTLTVEAGVTFATARSLLQSAEQRLGFDPAYADSATLGGIVATADSGSLRQRYNSMRDMLLGVRFARADGRESKAGGRVVKNVAGYDLMKLMTGSYGTLGCLSELTFRLYPIPEAAQTVVLTGTAEAIASTTLALLNSSLDPASADLLSSELVRKLDLGTGLGLLVQFQSISASVNAQTAQLLEWGTKQGLQGAIAPDTLVTDIRQQIGIQTEPTPAELEHHLTFKFGIMPAEAVGCLQQLDTLAPHSKAIIHANSGIGTLRCDRQACPPERLHRLRTYTHDRGGYLCLRQGAIAYKQQVDIWGYAEEGLGLMRAIKRQFDPDAMLSPHRFVGGI